MYESALACTSGLFTAPLTLVSLRPLTFSKEETWGEVGDCSGEESGEEDREVLSLVVRVRKIGILGDGREFLW